MSHVSRNGLRPYFMNQRRGLTLVELLVVLGVVSVLTAIILPSIKTVLTDRKSSQSAIIVKNFFEAARARAIGKNRTVAVVLERVSSRVDPSSFPSFVSATASSTVTGPDSNFVPYNACIRMSLAERTAQPCIGPERADLVLAGAAILQAVQELWPCERLRVADRGLREGLLLSMMAAGQRSRRRGRRRGAAK